MNRVTTTGAGSLADFVVSPSGSAEVVPWRAGVVAPVRRELPVVVPQPDVLPALLPDVRPQCVSARWNRVFGWTQCDRTSCGCVRLVCPAGHRQSGPICASCLRLTLDGEMDCRTCYRPLRFVKDW